MPELFNTIDEIYNDDLAKHPITLDRSKNLYAAGARFADQITGQIRDMSFAILQQIARERGASFSKEEIDESDALYEMFHILADKVLDGMEASWPHNIRN
jgi:hypothetical protein